MNKTQRKENPLLNVLLNIIIPVLILTKFSDPGELGPVYGLIVALIFPIGYGLREFIIERKTNILSFLGFASVLITGVIGLLKLNAEWIAIKEAAIPLIIGIAIIISMKTKYPLIKKLIFNDTFMNISTIHERLDQQGKREAFEKKLIKSSYWLALSFLFSAIMNFILAKIIVTSPAGTPEFNKELGTMTAYSFPVIAIPSTILLMIILWDLFKSLRNMTGLQFEEIIRSQS